MPKTKLTGSTLNPDDLITLKEASSRLGAGFSVRTLRRKIASGEYRQGVHYFRVEGNSGIIKIYLPAVLQKLIDINS